MATLTRQLCANCDDYKNRTRKKESLTSSANVLVTLAEKRKSKNQHEPCSIYSDTNGITTVTGHFKQSSNKCKKCYCCCRCCCCHCKNKKRDLFSKLSESGKMLTSYTIIFLLAVGVYWNSLSGDFVHDDVVAIVRNPDVNLAKKAANMMLLSKTSQFSSESAKSGWWSVWKNDYWGMPMSSPLSHKSYRPLTVLTFRLNYWMCGETLCSKVFHGTNVLIHGFVSCLMLYLCRGVLRLKLNTAIFASSLFALHPIHTEAVAGITGRADALACLMMLISFILYHKSIQQFNLKNQKSIGRKQCISSDGGRSTACDKICDKNRIKCGGGGEKVSAENVYDDQCCSTLDFHTGSVGFKFEQKSLSDCKAAAASLLNIVESSKSQTWQSPQASSSSLSIFSQAHFLLVTSALVGCLSMLAKETGITILGINLLYDLYNHHLKCNKKKNKKSKFKWQKNLDDDLTSSEISCATAGASGVNKRSAFTVSLIIISLAFRIALMDGTFPRFGRPDNPAAYVQSNVTRLLTFAYLPAFNFLLILYPRTLSYDWQMGSIPLVESFWDQRNLASAAFYVTLVSLTWKAQRLKKIKNLTVVVCLLFITLPFLPASNLLFPVGFVVAERVLYTSSVGVCILVSVGVDILGCLVKKHIIPENFRSMIVSISTSSTCLLLLLCFALRSWERNAVWQSRLSLFTSGIRDVPSNAKMHYNFANLQKDLGSKLKAIEHYTIAIRLWPDYASAHNNLGTLLMGNPAAAEHQFLKAISVGNQAHGGAHFNLGVLYMNEEKFSLAATHFKKSLIIDPSHQEAFQYYNICINQIINNHTNPSRSIPHDQLAAAGEKSKVGADANLKLYDEKTLFGENGTFLSAAAAATHNRVYTKPGMLPVTLSSSSSSPQSAINFSFSFSLAGWYPSTRLAKSTYLQYGYTISVPQNYSCVEKMGDCCRNNSTTLICNGEKA